MPGSTRPRRSKRSTTCKAKKQEIEKGWEHHLKTAGEAALALHAKAEEEELAKLKSSLVEASAKSRAHAVAK
jgi:hypothetical protein